MQHFEATPSCRSSPSDSPRVCYPTHQSAQALAHRLDIRRDVSVDDAAAAHEDAGTGIDGVAGIVDLDAAVDFDLDVGRNKRSAAALRPRCSTAAERTDDYQRTWLARLS